MPVVLVRKDSMSRTGELETLILSQYRPSDQTITTILGRVNNRTPGAVILPPALRKRHDDRPMMARRDHG